MELDSMETMEEELVDIAGRGGGGGGGGGGVR